MLKSTTIIYYDQNAQSFASTTISVNMQTNQNHFLKYLPPHAHILDFGCGSGRDTKYFLSQGYTVEATDGSEELCKIARAHTGISVKQMLFQELDEQEKYDGIWACSSILHLPRKELADVIRKMIAALKPNGIIYTSFKYGTFEGERNGRYFTDMTESVFTDFLQDIEGLTTEKQWLTSDVRPGREEKWLNLILRKIAI